MLVAKQLSNEYWGDAISIVVNIMNRCPMKIVKNNVPQEAWIGMKHSVIKNAPHGATQTIVPPSASQASQATLLSTPRVQQTPASCPSSTTSSNLTLASLFP